MDNLTNKENAGAMRINWTEKVQNLDETIRKEIGLEDDHTTKHILIRVQTKSAECIEPAFIVDEDDVFLDLFVLSNQTGGITSTAVIKDNIQSVGVIGGVSTEKVESSEVVEEPAFEGFEGLYQ